ncbi:MAG TPA: PepSY domain-containing protein [Candidatus Eisenbacteria bacterium]|nr:PepSY domain-containing protein [Candidatus Eisenbacteria bacterium]
MKLKNIICSVITVSALVGLTACKTEREEKEEHEGKHAKLEAQAKVSRADAEKAALAKVPGGTIKEGELEKEKGKLIWSFDISIPGSADIKEVQVDANSGEVVSVETETPAKEAKEKKEKD